MDIKKVCSAIIATVVLSLPIFNAMAATGPANPPAVGDIAKDFELSDLSGASIKLSALADAPGTKVVVLVVLRGYPGYQCPFCTAQYGDFKKNADAFQAATASVVFVYPGPADDLKAHAQEFLKDAKMPPNFHLLLDPDYTFTTVYGLRWDKAKETAYPSTFVIDPQRKITWAKVSIKHGNRAKASEVLAAISGKPVAATQPG